MSKTYYINGNVVRELEESQPIRRDGRSRREIEEARRKKNRRRAARRNRENAMAMSRGYVVFLTICVMAIAASAVSLVQMQSSVTQRMKDVAAIESQITSLRTENDAKYKEISTSIDLNYVKDVAMNQLGMKYAVPEQVVYYSVENVNYMDQYSDIPQ